MFLQNFLYDNVDVLILNVSEVLDFGVVVFVVPAEWRHLFDAQMGVGVALVNDAIRHPCKMTYL